MARLDKINDLYYSEAGDFIVSPQGDLLDTKLTAYRGFLQRIDTRVGSSKGDWDLQRSVGAGLTDFLGKVSSEQLALAVKRRVYDELYQEDLCRAGELTVDVLPIDKHSLAVTVIIKPPGATGQIVRLYTYSLSDNKIFIRNF